VCFGLGIAQVLREAMIEQVKSEAEAKNAFFVVDQNLYVVVRVYFMSPDAH
jgi:hypothetical protein